MNTIKTAIATWLKAIWAANSGKITIGTGLAGFVLGKWFL